MTKTSLDGWKLAYRWHCINEVVLNSLIATPVSEAYRRYRPNDGHPECLTANEVNNYTAWLVSAEANMVTGNIIRLYQR